MLGRFCIDLFGRERFSELINPMSQVGIHDLAIGSVPPINLIRLEFPMDRGVIRIEMIDYTCILFFFVVSAFKSQRRLTTENLVLRHQVIVLRRKHRGRIKLTGADRAILTWVSRIVPAIRDAIIIVKPETLLRWHRRGFRTSAGQRRGQRSNFAYGDRESIMGCASHPRRVAKIGH